MYKGYVNTGLAMYKEGMVMNAEDYQHNLAMTEVTKETCHDTVNADMKKQNKDPWIGGDVGHLHVSGREG